MRIFIRIMRILGVLLILGLGGYLIYHYFIVEDKTDDLVFESLSVIYDGQYHTLEVKNLTEDMNVEYQVDGYYDVDLSYKDVGVYEYTAQVYVDNKLTYELNATLEIVPRNVVVTGYDIVIDHGILTGDGYDVEGLVEGDDLQGEIVYVNNYSSTFKWDNKNYNVTYYQGKHLVSDTIIDSIGEYSPGWDELVFINPELFPVTFEDTSLFENKTITSISFLLWSYDENADTNDLNFVFYIVDKEFTRTKEECTIENGKKIVVDIKEYIDKIDESTGIVTIENLNIKIGEGETLVFGDADMKISFAGYAETDENMLLRGVFDNPLGSVYSLPLIIKGYWTPGGEE